jgi:hypothetical protein
VEGGRFVGRRHPNAGVVDEATTLQRRCAPGARPLRRTPGGRAHALPYTPTRDDGATRLHDRLEGAAPSAPRIDRRGGRQLRRPPQRSSLGSSTKRRPSSGGAHLERVRSAGRQAGGLTPSPTHPRATTERRGSTIGWRAPLRRRRGSIAVEGGRFVGRPSARPWGRRRSDDPPAEVRTWSASAPPDARREGSRPPLHAQARRRSDEAPRSAGGRRSVGAADRSPWRAAASSAAPALVPGVVDEATTLQRRRAPGARPLRRTPGGRAHALPYTPRRDDGATRLHDRLEGAAPSAPRIDRRGGRPLRRPPQRSSLGSSTKRRPSSGGAHLERVRSAGRQAGGLTPSPTRPRAATERRRSTIGWRAPLRRRRGSIAVEGGRFVGRRQPNAGVVDEATTLQRKPSDRSRLTRRSAGRRRGWLRRGGSTTRSAAPGRARSAVR